MKKMILVVAAGIVLGAAGFTGYKVHESQTRSPQEILMMQNLEALTQSEIGDGGHGAGSETANKKCPIWTVEEQRGIGTGGVNIIITCTTGGAYKCESGICPHGV